MRKAVSVAWVLAAALSVMPGCGGSSETIVPDAVTPDQVRQLEEDQKRVTELERQHQLSQQQNSQ